MDPNEKHPIDAECGPGSRNTLACLYDATNAYYDKRNTVLFLEEQVKKVEAKLQDARLELVNAKQALSKAIELAHDVNKEAELAKGSLATAPPLYVPFPEAFIVKDAIVVHVHEEVIVAPDGIAVQVVDDSDETEHINMKYDDTPF